MTRRRSRRANCHPGWIQRVGPKPPVYNELVVEVGVGLNAVGTLQWEAACHLLLCNEGTGQFAALLEAATYASLNRV